MFSLKSVAYIFLSVLIAFACSPIAKLTPKQQVLSSGLSICSEDNTMLTDFYSELQLQISGVIEKSSINLEHRELAIQSSMSLFRSYSDYNICLANVLTENEISDPLGKSNNEIFAFFRRVDLVLHNPEFESDNSKLTALDKELTEYLDRVDSFEYADYKYDKGSIADIQKIYPANNIDSSITVASIKAKAELWRTKIDGCVGYGKIQVQPVNGATIELLKKLSSDYKRLAAGVSNFEMFMTDQANRIYLVARDIVADIKRDRVAIRCNTDEGSSNVTAY